ncbi:glycosyltransferase family 29 protein [Pedobacter metabolipauper]|uniref:Glycosyl transferase family 29 (Putative sialyltransferase) n=1 Tax=Pedobacter metabolipauper TaxID=425513 RepID=A0A4R6SYY6_9SPHI|nr:glycosyltransferase family 29 protein [Pedobacter metabolipauper]TDQ09932.1 glycosyl transferase family 29 (putative sialyltransferase) [Pedobacter metabolipauper]
MIRLYKLLYGLLLTIRYTHRFSPALLINKRIVVVGPANSAYNTNKGSEIDAYDYVVRINKAPKIIQDGSFAKDIGAKTDILFHCFFENDFKGGGPLDFELFDHLGIQYVINPIPTYFGWRGIFNFYKKYLKKRPVYILPKNYYTDVKMNLEPFRPTTGLSALCFLMDQSFAELFITGFTFFKTPYGEGYRDELIDVDKNKAFIDKEKQHNIDLELETFKKILERAKLLNKNILLDEALQQIVKQN